MSPRPSSTSSSTRRSRAYSVDTMCAEAVEPARTAITEAAGSDMVGEHLGVRAEGDRVVTHFFAALAPAYRGWRWAVTVVRAARAKVVTVSESALLPGDGALLAPAWVPWSDRLRPDDLGPGDLLPSPHDDDRLVPGFSEADDTTERQMLWEPGLGRSRVLSSTGRAEAATRWYSGDHGPAAPLARSAPAQCSTCGFFLPLAGALRQVFGVCANEQAPDDGQVVAADHGCGAHSEVAVEPAAVESSSPIVDEMGYDVVRSAPVDEEAEEALGHS